ncbi:MAG TPA: sigma-70 family RNA polymerase sigma factor [Anaerolineales bacterium]|nr:sigma-70 family RNA polymerase sigma factor [Anaerolineales bacterium]
MAGKYTPYPDKDTIVALFDQFATPIYKYALRLCHDPIVGDNVVGDAFAQLLGQFVTGKDRPTDLRSYLYQTAYSSIVRYLRDRPHDPSVEPVVSAFEKSDIPSSQPQDDEQAMKEALFSALNNELAEDQRHVMSLHFLDDFSVKETAKILGKKVNEIKVSLGGIQKIMDNHPELPAESLTNKKKKR